MFTKRRTPRRTAASRTLNTLITLLWKTTCGGWCSGSGMAAAWTTTSAPRTTANASPASVRSARRYPGSPGSAASNTGATRSTSVTSWPAPCIAATTARPTLPRAPVTTTRMYASQLGPPRTIEQSASREQRARSSSGGEGVLKATLLKAAGSLTLQRQVTSNPVARRVASRFIAGNTLDEADQVIRALNAKGASVALDYLGENTESEAQAREATAAYLAALDRIHDHELDANISVKLTAMGLDISPALAVEEASKVAARGKEIGAMVGVDMESHAYVEPTLEVVERLKQSYDNVGVCLQAYLYRTRDDLDRLNVLGVPVRLVKGAYREPPEVAWAKKAQVDQSFAGLLDSLVAANPYPMVATHDPALVRLTKTLVAKHRRDR